MNDTLASVVTDARQALGSAGDIQGSADAGSPRFELFHAANSICSHKVRSVLAHHALPYTSHLVNMFQGQTYLPAYVRLRMVGCERFGGALVSRHTGSTAASAGCDGAVVPTLVDWIGEKVIVDSKRICIHLDDQMPDDRQLRPSHLAAQIDKQLAIVDDLPNYQMLMGRIPGAAEAATTASGIGGAFSQRKVAWCDQHLSENASDPTLVAAYRAKRAKELSAAENLFSPEAMRFAYERAELSVVELERSLGSDAGPWLHGDRVTMADLFWGIELLRMRNTGVSTFWENRRLPRFEVFAAAAETLPAIRTAVIDWPGAMF